MFAGFVFAFLLLNLMSTQANHTRIIMLAKPSPKGPSYYSVSLSAEDIQGSKGPELRVRTDARIPAVSN